MCGIARLVALSLPAWSAQPAVGPHGQILWDSFGVPHVFAKEEAGVFYGFGYAQVMDDKPSGYSFLPTSTPKRSSLR